MKLPRIEQRRVPAQRIAGRREFEREAAGERHDQHDQRRRDQDHHRDGGEQHHHGVKRHRVEIVAAAEVHAFAYPWLMRPSMLKIVITANTAIRKMNEIAAANGQLFSVEAC